MRIFVIIIYAFLAIPVHSFAETKPIQDILQENRKLIIKSSRKTIEPAIEAIVTSGLPQAKKVLQTWQNKDLWLRKEDGLFFQAKKIDNKTYELIDLENSKVIDQYSKSNLKQIKPNSGIRALIANALVRFQLSDPDPNERIAALKAIERAPSKEALIPLRASIDGEPNINIRNESSTGAPFNNIL